MNFLSSKPRKIAIKKESSDLLSLINIGTKSDVESEMEKLHFYRKQIDKQIENLVSFNLNIKDLYIVGILHRSKSLIDGFKGLVNQNNFVCALSLIRLHLDSLLRLYAPKISELDFNEFAYKVIYEEMEIGKLNSKFKTLNGKFDNLTDSYIANRLSELPNFLWVFELYKAANGIVHFSYKHVFASISPMENTQVQIANDNSDFIPEIDKNGAIGGMTKITRGIISMTEEWIENRKKCKNGI